MWRWLLEMTAVSACSPPHSVCKSSHPLPVSGERGVGISLWTRCLPPSPSPAAAAAKLLQSCPTLCDPIDGSPPAFPIPGTLKARTLEWVAISFSNAWKWKWKWSLSVVSDCSDPMDCSLPGSSIHGIFQAKVLEWGAIAFSTSILHKAIYKFNAIPIKITWNFPQN